MAGAATTIGVISDTHGVLRPRAIEALKGAQLIIHAGDVGQPAILDELRLIAPLVAVRGNVDYDDWADALPMTADVSLGQHRIHMLHILADLRLGPASGVSAVVYGHSHKPDMSWRDGVLYFNPGSAGPRRFTLPVTVGRLMLRDGQLVPEILDIDA
jgi:putative phosphoesterase